MLSLLASLLIYSISPDQNTIENCVQLGEHGVPHCVIEVREFGRVSVTGTKVNLKFFQEHIPDAIADVDLKKVNRREYFDLRDKTAGTYLFERVDDQVTISAAGFSDGVLPFLKSPLDADEKPIRNRSGTEREPIHNRALQGDARLMSPDGDTVQCVFGSVSQALMQGISGAAVASNFGSTPQEKVFWTVVGGIGGAANGFIQGVRENCKEPEPPKKEDVKPEEPKVETPEPPAPTTEDPPLEPIPTEEKKSTPLPESEKPTQAAPAEAPRGEPRVVDASENHPVAVQPNQAIILPKDMYELLGALKSIRDMHPIPSQPGHGRP